MFRPGLPLLLALLLAPSLAVAADPQEIRIAPGRQHVLAVPFPIGDTTNSNPKVIEASVDRKRREVILFARKKGVADYMVYHASNRKRRLRVVVRVTQEVEPDEADQIQQALADLDGVTVRMVGELIHIDGEVYTSADLQRVKRIAGRYPDAVNNVSLASSRLDAIAETIEQDIANAAITARPQGNKIVLRGRVFDARDKKAAVQIAKGYHDQVVDLIEVVD